MPMMYKRHLNQINLLDEPEYFGGIALDSDNERVKLTNSFRGISLKKNIHLHFPQVLDSQPAVFGRCWGRC